MIIIPAIDIIDKQPVRLYKGQYETKEIVGNNIIKIAIDFERQGAQYLHIVDLDGAKQGKLVNKEIILELAKKVNIPIEVGGGIRNYEDAEYLISNGISKVILGTTAISDKNILKKIISEFGEKVAVGVDCKNGYLFGKGWLESSKVYYLDFVKELELLGVHNIIVTDISKDGTLEGSNIEMIQKLKSITNIKITASGGVKDIEDIKKLKELNVYGVITGKAIYSKALDLSEAIKLCNGGDF